LISDFGSGLTFADHLSLCFQRTPTSEAPASRAVLIDGHTSVLAQQVDSIVANGRLVVCDGAHRAFVMKKLTSPGILKDGEEAGLICSVRIPIPLSTSSQRLARL
jgi:hypothetical protein